MSKAERKNKGAKQAKRGAAKRAPVVIQPPQREPLEWIVNAAQGIERMHLIAMKGQHIDQVIGTLAKREGYENLELDIAEELCGQWPEHYQRKDPEPGQEPHPEPGAPEAEPVSSGVEEASAGPGADESV